MRIGLDTHAIGARGTGNRSYIAGLMKGLTSIDQSNEYVFYVAKHDSIYASFLNKPNVHLESISRSAVGRLLFSLPVAALRHPVDILHVLYLPPLFWRSALIVTIHDLCFEHYPETFPWQELVFARRLLYWGAKHADSIITISEFSKQDIIRSANVPHDKVVVIPLSASENFYSPVEPSAILAIRQKYQLPADFVLFVGRTDDPRKNVEKIIRAYALLRNDGRIQHRLVIAGRHGPHTATLIRMVGSLGLDGEVSFPGIIPDDDLPALMAAADVFVYPSLFEGFGIPVLEAMACGTPVITSDRTSLPEVAGDAASIVSPDNVEQLAQAIESLINDRDLRTRLAQAGKARARLFSWARTARSTLDVYEAVHEQFHRRKASKGEE
jgi:glycosyltransferase involved in cell wall biosynthesis